MTQWSTNADFSLGNETVKNNISEGKTVILSMKTPVSTLGYRLPTKTKIKAMLLLLLEKKKK